MRIATAALAALLAVSGVATIANAAQGDTAAQDNAAAPAAKAHIPDLFDADRLLPKPDAAAVKSIRFATTDDFPPFHFLAPDGSVAGFDVDLARAICADLGIACTIQARRFDMLESDLAAGKDDALIAAIADTPETRKSMAFTAPYYTTPARFVVRTKSAIRDTTPEALAGQTVGVVSGTAHEAYLKAFYPKSVLKAYHSMDDLYAALDQKEVQSIFADGLTLAVWLNGDAGRACCAFRGGPYTESRFFGNGGSIAVGKGSVALREMLGYELAKLSRNGVLADLYLKYFPIGFY